MKRIALLGVSVVLICLFTLAYAGTIDINPLRGTGTTGRLAKWGTTSSLGDSLLLEGTNLISQVSGVNAQTFHLYKTFTDASNYERLAIIAGTNAFELTAQAAGTGTVRKIGLTAPAVGINTTNPSYTMHVSGAPLGGAFFGAVPSSFTTDDILYYGALPTVTGNVSAMLIRGVVSGSLTATFENQNSSSATAHGVFELKTNTGAGGDPMTLYTISGALNWATGVDNSDGDKYKISKSAELGTDDYLTIDTSGKTALAGHLTWMTDNSVDIGASGATRPRTLYAGTSVVAPAYTVGSTAGVSGTCSSVTVVNGIVTGCTP